MAVGEAVDLEALDARRYVDVYEANQLSAEALQTAPLEQLPYLLGIYASTERQLGNTNEAQRAIALGLRAARSLGDRRAEGELLQRLAYVFSCQADYRRAVDLTKRATQIFLDLIEFDSVGTCLVDLGQWLYYSGMAEFSRRCNIAALRLLPESLPRNRLCALMNLAHCERKAGRKGAAVAAADAAEQYQSAAGPALAGKLLWLRASLHHDRHDYAKAAKLLAEILDDDCASLVPIDRALAAVDLVYCLLKTNDLAGAYSTCRSYFRLLEPLRQQPHAKAAITELINCGHRARGLTIGFLAAVRRRAKGNIPSVG